MTTFVQMQCVCGGRLIQTVPSLTSPNVCQGQHVKGDVMLQLKTLNQVKISYQKDLVVREQRVFSEHSGEFTSVTSMKKHQFTIT